MNEMTEAVKSALNNGYTVMWDADVSNFGFQAEEIPHGAFEHARLFGFCQCRIAVDPVGHARDIA